MLDDDVIINALMRWAALDHSADAERQLDLPWHSTTARRAELARKAAVRLLSDRGIFMCGHLFGWAQAAFTAHLKLRQELAEIDPSQVVERPLLRAGAFSWALESRRRAERD